MVQRGGMMAAGSENITVANAYVQVMPSAQGIKEGVTEAIMPGMEAVGQQAGEGRRRGAPTVPSAAPHSSQCPWGARHCSRGSAPPTAAPH